MSKFIAALVTASLALNLGVATPAFAEDAANDKPKEEKKGETKDKKDEKPKDSDKKYENMWPKPDNKA